MTIHGMERCFQVRVCLTWCNLFLPRFDEFSSSRRRETLARLVKAGVAAGCFRPHDKTLTALVESATLPEMYNRYDEANRDKGVFGVWLFECIIPGNIDKNHRGAGFREKKLKLKLL